MRPEPASKRAGQASEGSEPDSERPGGGQTDGRTYTQIPPVFYRTSSPLDLLPKMTAMDRFTDVSVPIRL